MNYLILSQLLMIAAINSSVAQFNLEPDPIPIDTTIRHGRLSNGLTYYIKPIKEPQSSLYLNLIVNVGFNQEELHELDLSHAIEHLAFRSSDNFPLGLPRDKVMEKLAMGKKDITAATAYDYTHYRFNAPSNDPEALGTGLLWFKDIIDGLKLKAEDIDIERKVLRQEFVLRNGDNLSSFYSRSRMNSKLYPCVNDNLHFFERNENFAPEDLERFYRNWYRPDLSAVVIVGNIANVDSIENRIKSTLSSIPAICSSKEKRNCDSIYYEQPRQFFITQRYLDSSRALSQNMVKMHLFFRDSIVNNNLHILKGQKRLLLYQLLVDLLGKRLAEVKYRYKADYELTIDNINNPFALHWTITAQNGDEKKALQRFIQIVHQIKDYGVMEKEWMKAKDKALGRLDNSKAGTAEYWISEIIENYIYDHALPTDKLLLLSDWLENLSREEYNDQIKKIIKEMPEDIAIIANEEQVVTSLKENDLRSWITQTWIRNEKPYLPPASPKYLMSEEEVASLKPKPFIDKGIGKTGAREIKLENGLRVILVQEPSHKGDIKLHGFSPYGVSCFSSDDYFSAINAPSIIQNTGVGLLNKFQLNQFLSNTSLPYGVQPYIGLRETGIRGSASSEDFEVLLQLVYLYFTRPHEDKEAFEDWKRDKRNEFLNPPYNIANVDMKNNIKEILGDSTYINEATFQHKGLSKIDLGRSINIYKKLFGDANNFTIMVSGSFKRDSIMPWVQKYLGNLPATKNKHLCCSKFHSHISSLKKPHFQEFKSNYSMENTHYELRFLTSVSENFDWRKNIKIALVGRIFNSKLTELRYKKGFGIYSLKANGYYNPDLDTYITALRIECEASDIKDIQRGINEIILDIKNGTVSDVQFKKALEYVRSINSSQKYWLERRIYQHYRYNYPWVSQKEIDSYIGDLAIDDVVQVAATYYQSKYQYEFVMADGAE